MGIAVRSTDTCQPTRSSRTPATMRGAVRREHRMTSADDRVLDKVRKLLARAEHPSTPPPEAEAMSEKAAELMARYAIDRALIEQGDNAQGGPQRRDIQILAPYAMPKSVLLTQIASPYRVRTIIGTDNGTQRACTL